MLCLHWSLIDRQELSICTREKLSSKWACKVRIRKSVVLFQHQFSNAVCTNFLSIQLGKQPTYSNECFKKYNAHLHPWISSFVFPRRITDCTPLSLWLMSIPAQFLLAAVQLKGAMKWCKFLQQACPAVWFVHVCGDYTMLEHIWFFNALKRFRYDRSTDSVFVETFNDFIAYHILIRNCNELWASLKVYRV